MRSTYQLLAFIGFMIIESPLSIGPAIKTLLGLGGSSVQNLHIESNDGAGACWNFPALTTRYP